MKWTSLIFKFLAILILSQSLNASVDDASHAGANENCCRINGVLDCDQKCKPEINLVATQVSETTETAEDDHSWKEVVEEEVVKKPAAAQTLSLNANHICREGYRFESGHCKRVFGQTVERTTASSPADQ